MAEATLEELEKETKRLVALKAKLDAQQALEKAKNPAPAPEPDASAKAIKQAEADKAIADAKKAALDAEKARIDAAKALAASKLIDPVADATKDAEAERKLLDAQQTALVAKYIGSDVKAGPFSGKVDMKEKAGEIEASLLAMKAMRESAEKIAADLKDELATAARVYVFDAATPPSFDGLMNYRFRRQLIENAFKAALPKKTTGVVPESVTLATVAAGLGAVSNILGFFKTNTTIAGAAVKLENALALHVVAGTIARQSSREVHVPSLYTPQANERALTALTEELTALVAMRSEAAAALEALGEGAAKKPQGQRLQAAIDLYDSFLTHLTTTDANGMAPIVSIATQHAMWEGMGGGLVLLVRTEASGGGYMTKEGLGTGITGEPLSYMGGTALSYIVFKGLSGEVLAADVAPVYKSVKSKDLAEAL
ncbi:MAG TPA: hypothetical protein VEK11_22770 [Thermoanaerobaculia bacterium]|nr:hypothetical protein [Thermoanaerobaculia bacterium]